MLKNVTHILLIMAFVLTSASSACAFISGKNVSVIEICTALGVEYITVDEDGQRVEKPVEHDAQNDDCSFCFAQANFQAFVSDQGQFVYILSRDGAVRSYIERADRRDFSFYTARSPPLLVLS